MTSTGPEDDVGALQRTAVTSVPASQHAGSRSRPCEASSGDRLRPRLTHRACWLDRLGELHDRPSVDGAGFIVGARSRGGAEPALTP